MRTNPSVPALGLGTYRNTEYERCKGSVLTALDVGYRHIDTAEAYRNEEAVGDALATSDVPREEVFLATKVLHPKFADGYDAASIVDAAHSCLERLGVEYVDLFYGVHWPGDGYDAEETFAACTSLYEEGTVRQLGVCNMTPVLLEEARSVSDVPISALQVELHPLLPQAELRSYCDTHDISVVAYAPLGNGRMFEVPELLEIAEERDVGVAQVSLAWLRRKGVAAIPKATGTDHIRENWGSLEVELTDDELRKIDDILHEERQYDPEYAPKW
ncbi:aldo/keto reductase [Natronorarus salvus]|uniref:aldo/keto reductase n=1 Tax=Natronorarus salvus TaxID=3117733 RepID=UPI002F262546